MTKMIGTPNALYAASWMMGALASFCLMAIGARELSGLVDTFQILFFRSVIGLAVITLVIIFSGKRNLITTQRLGLHTFRNVFHLGGQYGWIVGIGILPLAEVFAIEFTVPVWTALIACVFLKESITLKKVLSITLGLIGVIVIVKPGIEIIDVASLTVLIAAICYAIAHACTKALSVTEDPLTILFQMCLIQLPIAFALALGNWAMPNGIEWLWVSIIGVSSLTAHYCMAKAMQNAEVTLVVTLDFLRLPVIAIIGVVFYAEGFEISLLIGGAIMLLGNLVNMYSPNNRIQPLNNNKAR